VTDPEPQPRPGLYTNGDWDAWRAQVRFLRLVLRMPWERIAAIDHGILPEHPREWQDILDFAAGQHRRMFEDEPDLRD
jgi:hypothetical protein